MYRLQIIKDFASIPLKKMLIVSLNVKKIKLFIIVEKFPYQGKNEKGNMSEIFPRNDFKFPEKNDIQPIQCLGVKVNMRKI